MAQDKSDYVTVSKGMGFFASHLSWDDELGGHTPWSTVSQHYATADEAERAAQDFAKATGMRFEPWTRPYRTLDEADRYSAIQRRHMLDRRAASQEIRNTLGITGRPLFDALEALGMGFAANIGAVEKEYLATA